MWLNRQKKEKKAVNIPRTHPPTKPGKPACPICSSDKCSPVYSGVGHLCRCGGCGAAFNIAYRRLDYGERYFVDEYRSQYGRTYEEDSGTILALSNRRLDDIFGFHGRRGNVAGLSLLDIGSALGYFLKAAKDRGIGGVQGLEVSKYAAEFCRKRFDIKVKNTSFEKARFNDGYDIITAWYFIEHCADPFRAVSTISGLLNPGGVFAMATPSIFGPLYMFDRMAWIEQHPKDHRVDFSPSSIRRMLKRAGFTRISIHIGGIHPERILAERSLIYKPFSAVYSRISRLIRFSDTIEVFAVK